MPTVLDHSAMAPGLAIQSFIAKPQMKAGDTEQIILAAPGESDVHADSDHLVRGEVSALAAPTPVPNKDTATGLKDW